MYQDLKNLLLIVEHGTMSKAARHAGLSQPAFSASVRRTEEFFGVSIFHRGRAGCELSAEGKLILPDIRDSLARIEDCRRSIAELRGLQRGRVSLGAGATACTYILPSVLASFRKKHPNVQLVLKESISGDLPKLVEQAKVDIAVVSGTGSEALLDDRLVLVASPKQKESKPGFITFPQGSATRAMLEKLFPDAEIVMELSSIAAVKGNVRAGIGMALLSIHAVENDLKTGRLVEIQHRKTPVVRKLSLLHRGRSRLSPAASQFRSMLLENIKGR